MPAASWYLLWLHVQPVVWKALSIGVDSALLGVEEGLEKKRWWLLVLRWAREGWHWLGVLFFDLGGLVRRLRCWASIAVSHFVVLIALVRSVLLEGGFRCMVGTDGRRTRPIGTPAAGINCVSVGSGVWGPSAVEMRALLDEGAQLAQGLVDARHCGYEMVAQKATGQPQGQAVIPIADGGAQNPGVDVGAMGPHAGSPQNLGAEVSELRAVLEELRLHQLTGPENEKDKEKDKDKKKDKKEVYKKKKKRKGIGSSSNSRHSSRSSSSSSSNSESRKRKYVRCRPAHMEVKRCTSEAVERTETMHCRKRKDLLQVASRHPGALGAHLLLQVRRKLMKSAPKDTKDLARTDVASWAGSSSNDIKDLRDVKEVMLLGKLMMMIGEGKTSEAVDTMAMRIREVRMAKAPGGSWEKAAALSLLATSVPVNTSLPDGALTL